MSNDTNDAIVRLASKEVMVRHKPHCHKQGKTEARFDVSRSGTLTIIMYCENCGVVPIIPE